MRFVLHLHGILDFCFCPNFRRQVHACAIKPITLVIYLGSLADYFSPEFPTLLCCLKGVEYWKWIKTSLLKVSKITPKSTYFIWIIKIIYIFVVMFLFFMKLHKVHSRIQGNLKTQCTFFWISKMNLHFHFFLKPTQCTIMLAMPFYREMSQLSNILVYSHLRQSMSKGLRTEPHEKCIYPW